MELWLTMILLSVLDKLLTILLLLQTKDVPGLGLPMLALAFPQSKEFDPTG